MIIKKLMLILRRWRGRIRRLKRLIYMSPAEAKFVELMGGKIYRLSRHTSRRTGFPVTFVKSLGPDLKAERFKREVRVGKYFVDFGNDIGRTIEIDGSQWHMDVIADLEREGYLQERGQTIMRIPAHRIYHDPKRVRRDTLKFINR